MLFIGLYVNANAKRKAWRFEIKIIVNGKLRI